MREVMSGSRRDDAAVTTAPANPERWVAIAARVVR